MSTKYLGRTFDIHGGGRDLIFPHHENEIAQSEAANLALMTKFWIHNGHVTKDGVKISKSLGNFIPLVELYKLYDPEAVKFFLYGVHYRSPLDFTDQGMRQAERNVERFYQTIKLALDLPENDSEPDSKGPLAIALAEIEEQFVSSMDDDFNTAKVLAVFFDFLHLLNQQLAMKKLRKKKDQVTLAKVSAKKIVQLGKVLGLFNQDPDSYLLNLRSSRAKIKGIISSDIEDKIEERLQARKNKDFAMADSIRDELAKSGVILEDNPEGTDWRIEM